MKLEAYGRIVDLCWDDPDDHIPRRIVEAEDFYERPLLEDARARVSGGLAVDAGAHIGNHTLWFAAVMGLDVVAFEPQRNCFDRLWENVAANGLEDRVSMHRIALGDGDGWARIVYGPAHNSGASRVVPGYGPVPVRTLDSFDLRPSLVKVDVEDSCSRVLYGALQTIRRSRPVLYVECGEDQDHVTKLLAEEGYRHVQTYGATPVAVYKP